jgi:hypothetical protein
VPYFTNLICLVGLEAVGRIAVLVCKDSDGSGTEFEGGAKRPNRDFTPVRNENLFEQCTPPSRVKTGKTTYSTGMGKRTGCRLPFELIAIP